MTSLIDVAALGDHMTSHSLCYIDSGCIADEDHPQLTFLGQSQSVELTASSEGNQVDMSDIGFNMSVPPGAVPADQPLSFSARPVAGGNIDMSANCVAHSPLYILPSLQMQEKVKITIDHSCNIASQEDCDNMVFLGVVDTGQHGDGSVKLEEVEDVVVDFKIGNQKGCIYLQDVRSLRIGRKFPSHSAAQEGMHSRPCWDQPLFSYAKFGYVKQLNLH